MKQDQGPGDHEKEEISFGMSFDKQDGLKVAWSVPGPTVFRKQELLGGCHRFDAAPSSACALAFSRFSQGAT